MSETETLLAELRAKVHEIQVELDGPYLDLSHVRQLSAEAMSMLDEASR